MFPFFSVPWVSGECLPGCLPGMWPTNGECLLSTLCLRGVILLCMWPTQEWIVTAMAYLLLSIFLTACLDLDLGLLHRCFSVSIWSGKSVLSPLFPNTCGRAYECQFHDLWGDRSRRGTPNSLRCILNSAIWNISCPGGTSDLNSWAPSSRIAQHLG